jgi:hypothetical protein
VIGFLAETSARNIEVYTFPPTPSFVCCPTRTRNYSLTLLIFVFFLPFFIFLFYVCLSHVSLLYVLLTHYLEFDTARKFSDSRCSTCELMRIHVSIYTATMDSAEQLYRLTFCCFLIIVSRNRAGLNRYRSTIAGRKSIPAKCIHYLPIVWPGLK